MATREENLKKINDELEQLTDEQLDEIAGGVFRFESAVASRLELAGGVAMAGGNAAALNQRLELAGGNAAALNQRLELAGGNAAALR